MGGPVDESVAEVALDEMNRLSVADAEPSNIGLASAAFDLGKQEDFLIEFHAALQVANLHGHMVQPDRSGHRSLLFIFRSGQAYGSATADVSSVFLVRSRA